MYTTTYIDRQCTIICCKFPLVFCSPTVGITIFTFCPVAPLNS